MSSYIPMQWLSWKYSSSIIDRGVKSKISYAIGKTFSLISEIVDDGSAVIWYAALKHLYFPVNGVTKKFVIS